LRENRYITVLGEGELISGVSFALILYLSAFFCDYIYKLNKLHKEFAILKHISTFDDYFNGKVRLYSYSFNDVLCMANIGKVYIF
jgi:hypothetical protein